ncbi:reverse transcriptase domain-containing protein [Tanacetum coccineum]
MVNVMSQMQKMLHERPQGALPSNTEPNPREQVNSIMTRSGLITVEPSLPSPILPNPREEGENELETLMDEVHITSSVSTAHVPPPGIQPMSLPKPKEDPKPNPHQPKIPYPLRLNKTKLLDKNDIQVSKFLKILKQLHFDISLMDALTQILKYHKVSGASINLMPLSIYEKIGIGPLKPTRMTLELANRSVTYLMGIAEYVIVKVEKFKFLVDFVIVDFEADPRVPIILGRPFSRTSKALVDLYEEKLTLRVGNEEVVSFPSSPLVETSDSSLEEFADELALLDPFPTENEDDNFDLEADL